MTDVLMLMMSLSRKSETTEASSMLQNVKAFFSEDRHYKRCTWTTLKQIHAFYMSYNDLNMFYET